MMLVSGRVEQVTTIPAPCVCIDFLVLLRQMSQSCWIEGLALKVFEIAEIKNRGFELR